VCCWHIAPHFCLVHVQVAVLDVIWTCVVPDRKNMARFLVEDGLDALLSLLEVRVCEHVRLIVCRCVGICMCMCLHQRVCAVVHLCVHACVVHLCVCAVWVNLCALNLSSVPKIYPLCLGFNLCALHLSFVPDVQPLCFKYILCASYLSSVP